MPRTRHLGLAALTLVLLASAAFAEPKKKIAVLGLEAVVGANGQIDPADTKFAKELTAELRSRANNSKGYDLTKDQRELVDEKLMNNCASEKPECMAPIGASMGADVVLFGKVANAKGGYKVSLTLVDVRKKTVIGTDPNATVSTADTRNPGLGGWVRDHYRKVTNESGDGTLIITASGGAGNGRVLVNGDPKETLRGGTATLTLPEGRYKVGVEADGFKLWEQDAVTITAEKPTELKPELVRTKPIDTQIDPNNTNTTTTTTGTTGGDNVISTTGSVSGTKSKTVWKVAAGVGLGGAALGTGFIIYSYTKMSAFQDTKVVDSTFPGLAMNDNTVDQDNCGEGKFSPVAGKEATSNASDLNSKFSAACSAKDRMKWLVPTTIGLAAIGAGALIYVMISGDSTESKPANAGRRSKKRNFIVTPVVTPDGTGATMRFDW